jgi:hypothetical protein
MPKGPPAVLEFESARSLWHGALLRAAGMPGKWRWAVSGAPNQVYEYRGLVAHVQLVAYERGGSLSVVRFMPGRTRAALPRTTAAQGVLESAVVGAVLTKRGKHVTQIATRWAFDDGGHVEDVGPARVYSDLLLKALEAVDAMGGARTTVPGLLVRWLPTLSIKGSAAPENRVSRLPAFH